MSSINGHCIGWGRPQHVGRRVKSSGHVRTEPREPRRACHDCAMGQEWGPESHKKGGPISEAMAQKALGLEGRPAKGTKGRPWPNLSEGHSRKVKGGTDAAGCSSLTL